MITYDLDEAASRIGLTAPELAQLCELEIIRPDGEGRFSPGHLRRAGLVKSLSDSGIPLDGLATAIRSGQFSLDFLDAPAGAAAVFREVGPVELKGVTGAMNLHSASLPG